MLDRSELEQKLLAKMRELGLKIDEPGVKSSVLADLLVEMMLYIVEKNEVQVDPGSGKGKFT